MSTETPFTFKAVEEAARVADKALDEKYHYGLAKPGSFGEAANRASAQACLRGIFGECLEVEELAARVHEGWSAAVFLVDDPAYAVKPEKKQARLALATRPYHLLSEEEQEKDLVIARAILSMVANWAFSNPAK